MVASFLTASYLPTNYTNMSRLQFFIITSAVIFLIERILPILTNWPVSIFPFFIVFFMLFGKNGTRDLSYAVMASIFFDPFSGYSLGLFTLAILIVCFCAQAFKDQISVDRGSFFLIFIFSIIFVSVFFIVLSLGQAINPMLQIVPWFLIQAAIINIVLLIWGAKFFYDLR